MYVTRREFTAKRMSRLYGQDSVLCSAVREQRAWYATYDRACDKSVAESYMQKHYGNSWEQEYVSR